MVSLVACVSFAQVKWSESKWPVNAIWQCPVLYMMTASDRETHTDTVHLVITYRYIQCHTHTLLFPWETGR